MQTSKFDSIPPGISFYTFQMIAFMVDTIKYKHREPIKFVDYLNFASFFPQVVAGPIERRSKLLPQIQNFRFRFSIENIDAGLSWIALGVFMKFVLADNLAVFIDLNEIINVWIIWLSIFLFGLRIYFDFAGYSFIALGIARCLGINLTINFLAPYTSLNIGEFWRRWHVTLSGWFRDYVYIPLGGSRVRWVSINLLIVFGVSGLWHGAGWNYVLWGCYHGLLLIIYRSVRTDLIGPRPVKWALTFGSVMFGWLFFMETDFDRLLLKLKAILDPAGYKLSYLNEFFLVWFRILRSLW